MPRTFIRIHVMVATDEGPPEATSSIRWELDQSDVDSLRLATLLRDEVKDHIGPAIRFAGKAKPPILTERCFLEAGKKDEPNGANGATGADDGAKHTPS